MKRGSKIGLGMLLAFVVSCGMVCQLRSPATLTGFAGKGAIKGAVLDPATKLAVIYNIEDSLSVEIAHYYQLQRGIPQRNMIAVSFNPELYKLSQQEFSVIKAEVDAKVADEVQFFALAWSKTVRVECMSITSAFAFGFNPGLGDGSCVDTCTLGAMNPYAVEATDIPFVRLAMRPTMMLAASDFTAAKALIDRGVAADGSSPTAHRAYLMITDDGARNVRKGVYEKTVYRLSALIPIEIVEGNVLSGREDVMFYFTGLKEVPEIDSNYYLPGAIADHLTSAGGIPDNKQQMSAMRWLEAGATGSYGAVVEPCNHLEKFPHPGVLMAHYLQGTTLIEAYWKSVLAPGQGVFIGEPLARPYFAGN